MSTAKGREEVLKLRRETNEELINNTIDGSTPAGAAQ
jgi:hypothetical protein